MVRNGTYYIFKYMTREYFMRKKVEIIDDLLKIVTQLILDKLNIEWTQK